MRVYKDTPFEFGLMPWVLEPPALIHTIFVKGTFTLAPGECPIAGEQATIHGEVPFDDAEIPSVQSDSDFAVVKPRGEWLLTGSAFAANGRPVTVLPLTVRVGGLEKQLVVHGDRHWERGLLGAKPSAAAPFAEMPLRWERSFGGPRIPDNPSGRGVGPVDTPAGRIEPLANIEDPRRPIVSKEDQPPPAGAFPIPSTWRARTALLGTFDDHWKRTRWPYFPRDFDPRFFQAAPADQQLREGYWRGDERIALRGLSAAHPVLETRLPAVRARVFVEWERRSIVPSEPSSGEPSSPPQVPRPSLEEVGLVLDTIRIDTSTGRVCCVWRGMLRGVRDVQMSNVARLFFVHEPLATREPHAYYEDWLWRRLLEERAEAEDMEAGEPAAEMTEPPAPPPIAAAEGIAAGLGTSMKGVFLALGDLLEAEEALLGKPKASEVRAALEAEGVEPPEDLVDPEPPPPIPEEVESVSLRRLAALIRHRLRRPFDGEDLTEAPFRALDLRGASFRGAILTRADLRGARLDGALLEGAVLAEAKLEGASLIGASLEGTEMAGVDLRGADLREANLRGAASSEARFAGANLEKAQAAEWSAEGSDLTGARLAGAVLTHADLTRTKLERADFTGANLEHTDISGAMAEHACFERCVAPDLRASERTNLTDAKLILMEAPNAQLQGAIAFRANFSGSNLAGADLSEAVLCEANFVRCLLGGAKLARADLKLAQMLQANLMEADLEEADLREADLRGAHLYAAQLWRALTEGARLDGASLERTHLEGI